MLVRDILEMTIVDEYLPGPEVNLVGDIGEVTGIFLEDGLESRLEVEVIISASLFECHINWGWIIGRSSNSLERRFHSRRGRRGVVGGRRGRRDGLG